VLDLSRVTTAYASLCDEILDTHTVGRDQQSKAEAAAQAVALKIGKDVAGPDLLDSNEMNRSAFVGIRSGPENEVEEVFSVSGSDGDSTDEGLATEEGSDALIHEHRIEAAHLAQEEARRVPRDVPSS